jgi:hypothetical protein
MRQLSPVGIEPTTQVLPVPRRKSDGFAPPIVAAVICSGAVARVRQRRPLQGRRDTDGGGRKHE